MRILGLAAAIAAIGLAVGLTTACASTSADGSTVAQSQTQPDTATFQFLAANFSAANDCPWFTSDPAWWTTSVVREAQAQWGVSLDGTEVFDFAALQCGIEA